MGLPLYPQVCHDHNLLTSLITVEDGHYEGGRATKEKLMNHVNDVLKVYRTWVCPKLTND